MIRESTIVLRAICVFIFEHNWLEIDKRNKPKLSNQVFKQIILSLKGGGKKHKPSQIILQKKIKKESPIVNGEDKKPQLKYL